jgi:hypothetical protein
MSEQPGMSDQQLLGDGPDPHPFGETPSIFRPLALQRQTNPMAKAGLILAILVWPIGLVLSVIALFKASKRGGAGWTAGIWGVLISLVLASVTVFLVSSSNSHGSDPGCRIINPNAPDLDGAIQNDESQLAANVGTPSVELSLANQLDEDLQSANSNLDQAAEATTNKTLLNMIDVAGVDLTQVTTQLQSTESSGVLPEATQKLFLTLNGDLGNIDQYCSN